jgi:hypothetical protein
MKKDVFKDIVPSIMRTGIDELENEKDYQPVLVNKALSFHLDCILDANMMNVMWGMDHRLQYDYLLNRIRKYNRKFSWHKKSKPTEDEKVLMEYYGYSEQRAKQVVHILTREQIDEIKTRIKTGGLHK